MAFTSSNEFSATTDKNGLVTYKVTNQVINYRIDDVEGTITLESDNLLFQERDKILMCKLVINDITRVFKVLHLQGEPW